VIHDFLPFLATKESLGEVRNNKGYIRTRLTANRKKYFLFLTTTAIANPQMTKVCHSANLKSADCID
jgi:hypothetical protein